MTELKFIFKHEYDQVLGFRSKTTYLCNGKSYTASSC